MAKIHLLEDLLISQIAAGEVVERPASVVKELLENALDAGARQVEIDLEAGGKRRIRVVDDGSGMGRDDALLAFDRHATSKIKSFDDLERIGTLGFRGEALASIAAVARVELLTAEEPGEGQRVRIEGGRIKSVEPVPRPRGTAVEVASLFFNVPARRKFLKTPQTELRRALEVVQGYVLARPDLRFTVRHGGREVLHATATSDSAQGRRDRVAQVFGPTLADNLVALPAPEGAAAGGPRESVSGLLGNRDTVRGRRQFVFVNRRLIRDRAVLAVFYRTVREEWKGDDFPALFLFLDLPPEDVDINVHPQKAEVRFRNAAFLPRVEEVLRRGLGRARGEEPAPVREGWTSPPAGTPVDGAPAPHTRFSAPLAWREWKETREAARDWGGTGPDPQGRTGASEVREPGAPVSFGAPVSPASGLAKLPEVTYPPLEPSSIPLSGRKGGRRSFRLLGQYKATVVLLEGPDGLYLVDQHVAHERILYERFRRALEKDRPQSQSLLNPVLLELAPAEAQTLKDLAPDLEACGFSLAALSGDTVGLTSVPAVLTAQEAEGLLLALASESGEEAQDPQDLNRRLVHSLAASQACRTAVKMHHPLSRQEMETLIEELFEAEQPYACPHGRPIVLRMTDSDLERRFGRR